MSPSQPSDSPYRVIAAEIRARITSGDLRPGDRVPSVRQIAQRWGVAVATATRVTAALRDEGLVEPRVGSGTIVSTRGKPQRPASLTAADRTTSPTPPRVGPADRAMSLDHILHAAISVADVEGLDAVSMRRLATHLGVGPMSLYRHVANKDELLTQMANKVFGEVDLPEPGSEGWRANLELVARKHWQLCRTHPWLPRTVSFTRPLLAPGMMAHTEWILRALDGLGLSMSVRTREALALHALVLTAALAMADEAEAEHSTGVTLDRWSAAQRTRKRELLDSGRFPLLATLPEDFARDLDQLFEYSLARHLDGFAVLL